MAKGQCKMALQQPAAARMELLKAQSKADSVEWGNGSGAGNSAVKHIGI